MSHLLVTNDFPPKTGGIQVYLWELWRRLDPASFTVLTASSHPDAGRFDAAQRSEGFAIHRTAHKILLPTPDLVHRTKRLAEETKARLVVIDPALPLGVIGPRLGLPYAVILHGAELVAPARLPLSRTVIRDVLAASSLAICAGDYPADEVRRLCRDESPPIVVVPPGVDTERYKPIDARATRQKARLRDSFGLPETGLLALSVSRLVPRKGMDAAIDAVAALVPSFPGITLAIAGSGRDLARLRRRAVASGSPVHFLGRVADDRLPDLYAIADVFVMACRDRWLGLEQEGFGIVFLEAAACGVPQVAGRSGGSAEAVSDGDTGIVVDDPSDAPQVAAALRRLLSDQRLRRSMGRSARMRAVESFEYSQLSFRLAAALHEVEG